jgi:hypothetical protein
MLKFVRKELVRYLDRMDKLLADFSHPAYSTRNSIWFLSSIPSLKQFLGKSGFQLELSYITRNSFWFLFSSVP